MKKNIIYIGTILLCWFACEKIDPPYTSDIIPAGKTILIEKFTAHECQNCPAASRIIENELKPTFLNTNDTSKSAIISVSIHPAQSNLTLTSTNYNYDFTTDGSNQVANYLGVDEATALPIGGINRVESGNGKRLWSRDKWSEQITSLLIDEEFKPLPKNIDIEIDLSVNTMARILNVSATISVLNSLEGNYSLALFVMEDGIIAPQKDGDELIENYKHDHVYRCPINGWNGEPLNITLTKDLVFSSTNKTIVFNTENNTNWTSEWNNINNCYVVAYVYNSQTGVIEEVNKKRVQNE